MIAGIVSAEAGAGFADGVVAGRAAGSVAKPLGDGSASSQKLHPLAFRNPSNVVHPIPKCSQTFGIFAAFGFRRSCVTTVPPQAWAAAIRKGSATGWPVIRALAEISEAKWGTARMVATNRASAAVGGLKIRALAFAQASTFVSGPA